MMARLFEVSLYIYCIKRVSFSSNNYDNVHFALYVFCKFTQPKVGKFILKYKFIYITSYLYSQSYVNLPS